MHYVHAVIYLALPIWRMHRPLQYSVDRLKETCCSVVVVVVLKDIM